MLNTDIHIQVIYAPLNLVTFKLNQGNQLL